MAIEIKFLANVARFLKGTDSIEEALEDVAHSLDDVAKDSKHAADDMADDFKDSSKDIDKSTERLDKSFKDLADSAKKAGNDAGDGLSRGITDGTHKAEAGLDDLKSESSQTARESAASFTGEWTDVGDIFQEIAANAFSGFGPAGMAAGLLAAAGIGLAVSAIEGGIEGAEEYRAKVEELGQEFIDTGTLSEASIDFIVDKLKDMATTTEDGQVSLKDLSKLANTTQTDFKNLAQAYGNNTDELKDLWRENDALRQSYEDQADALDTTTSSGAAAYGQLLAQADAQRQIVDYIGQQIGISAEAAEAQRLYAEAGGPELEAKAELLGLVNDAYDESAGDIESYLNAESGLFDVQAYIDSMNARSQALSDYQSDLAASELSPAAKSFLNSQGAEAAAQFLAGYKTASPANKSELNRLWSEAGKANSGEYTTALNKGLPDRLDKKPKVEAEADTSAANRDLNNFASRTRHTRIVADVVDKFGRPVG